VRLRDVGLPLALALALAGCGRDEPAPGAPTASATASRDGAPFAVLAGSELRDIEPAMKAAAAGAGVNLTMTYAGTLDIVERLNAGEHFDAVLPPNGAYPALALERKPLARDKLFYSRVAFGVKAAKARELGWTQQAPTWADIAQAAGQGRLHYAMTNPASSNTGMSALFAVASAVAGKTEDLTPEEVKPDVIKAFLAGQKLTAGSSGWLADAYVREAPTLDAMVNYEAVILRTNAKVAEAHRLLPVYPRDGVISADYPLLLLEGSRRADYDKLVVALKAEPFQRRVAGEAFLRASLPGVPLAEGLSAAPVAELSFPNRLEVIDAVLVAYQGEWRRPATSIFVLDVSGSMKGRRLDAMREALKVLAGVQASTASARYASFQRRERVALIAFSDRVQPTVEIDFGGTSLDEARQRVLQYADDLHVDGGTAIYAALLQARQLARQEHKAEPERFVSIVLLTDGQSNVGPKLDDFRRAMATDAGGVPIRIFPILFGEGNASEMDAVAQVSGGRVFDGRTARLAGVFKDIRGYQ